MDYIWSEVSDLSQVKANSHHIFQCILQSNKRRRIKRRFKPKAEVQEGLRAAIYKNFMSETSAKDCHDFKIEFFAPFLQFGKMEALDEVDRHETQLQQLNARSN